MKLFHKRDILFIILIIFIFFIFVKKISPASSYQEEIKQSEKRVINNREFNNSKQIEKIILYYAVFRRDYKECKNFYNKIPLQNINKVYENIVKEFPKYKIYLERCRKYI